MITGWVTLSEVLNAKTRSTSRIQVRHFPRQLARLESITGLNTLLWGQGISRNPEGVLGLKVFGVSDLEGSGFRFFRV